MIVAWDLRIWVGVCPSYNDLRGLWFLGLMGQLGRLLFVSRWLAWLIQLLDLLHQLRECRRVALLQPKPLPMALWHIKDAAKDVTFGDVTVSLGDVGGFDAEAVVAPQNEKVQFMFAVDRLTVFENGFG